MAATATTNIVEDKQEERAIIDDDDDKTTITNNQNNEKQQQQQQQESNDDYNYSHQEDNDQDDLNDEYFETLDIDKLNLNNNNNTNTINHYQNGTRRENVLETPQDSDSNPQNETKLTNIEYNRFTNSIDTSCTNYDHNIDLKDLLSNRSDNFHDSDNGNDKTSNNNHHNNETDNPIINKFIKEAIVFGANALDLSKKNLVCVPKLLFKLQNLQVI